MWPRVQAGFVQCWARGFDRSIWAVRVLRGSPEEFADSTTVHLGFGPFSPVSFNGFGMTDNSEAQRLSSDLASTWGCSGLRKRRPTSRNAVAQYHSRLVLIVAEERPGGWTEKPTADAISQAATRVRWSLRLLWGSQVSCLAAVVLGVMYAAPAFWFAVFFAPLAVSGFASVVWAHRVRCPRCHHAYMTGFSRSDLPEPKACQHCKFRLFKALGQGETWHCVSPYQSGVEPRT